MNTKSRQPATIQATIRCAVYTRKSTEEGLEQEFNSLDAQRESGENYIRSQASEGWLCLPDRYDDGGYTGGNMDRPALKRLLADVEAGRVDCIVVYKVDRLSRSLLDFAKMVESFDRHHVSFVSVTQLINTSTSMGRLMLNVLLSFAQFEREIISERTRDKIAAARRRGKWAGGMPRLGYDVDPRGSKLVVNEAEAARVRSIFELYLEHQSMIGTIAELDKRGWVNKRWTTRKGRERGGKPFNKSSLWKFLTNVTYLGKIKCKDEIHVGEHAAIFTRPRTNRRNGPSYTTRFAKHEKRIRARAWFRNLRSWLSWSSDNGANFLFHRNMRVETFSILDHLKWLDIERQENPAIKARAHRILPKSTKTWWEGGLMPTSSTPKTA